MASSDDTRLGPSSRDLTKIGTKQNVSLLVGTKSRNGLKSLSFSFRQLCLMGTVFAVVMGLLSRTYFEAPVQILMESDRFDRAKHVESLPKYRSIIIDATASDLSLRLLEEESPHSSSSNGIASSESAQEGESSSEQQGRGPDITVEKAKEFWSHLPTEDSRDDEKPVNDGHVVPSTERDHTQQGEEQSGGDKYERHAKDQLSKTVQTQQPVEETKLADQSTADSAKIKVSPPQQGERVDVIPSDLQQDGNQRTSREDKERVDSKEEQHRSPIYTILQPTDSARKSNQTSSTGRCDLTVGKWVHDSAGPHYSSDKCSILSSAQNCQRNGRRDHGYEFYRWEPAHCSLPRFDPQAFLELMRGKTLAFIGDSLARNQMESLMCILLQVAEARSKGSKGVHKWYFPSHGLTIIRMWSSWLVQFRGDFPPSVPLPNITKLNLTELDDYADHLPTFDVTILSSGHWWLRKTAYFSEGALLGGMGWRWPSSLGKMKMNHSMAFEIALNTALQNVGSYPGYKGLTILRTYTPDHYSGGRWDTGGSCTGETKPYDKAPKNSYHDMMRDKQLKAFKTNTRKSREGIMPNGSKLRLLDVYPILNYRGDGHPGPYRNTDALKDATRGSKGRPPSQDCLHWCMPGPVDTMNDLLFDLLRKDMQ